MKRLSFFLALILVLSLLSTAVFSAQGLSVSPLQDATESTLSSDPSETEEPAEPTEPEDPTEPTEPENPTEPTEPEDPTPEPLYPKTEQHPIYVSGSSDGFFRPRASLTRSEFAQIIYRLTDLPDSEDCPFSDIPDNKWYTRYLVSEILVKTLEEMHPSYPELAPEEAARIPQVMEELGIVELEPESAPEA